MASGYGSGFRRSGQAPSSGYGSGFSRPKSKPKKKESPSFLGFLGNVGEGIKDLAVASGPGALEVARFVAAKPRSATFGRPENERFLRAAADDYGQRYGPLVRGDVGEFAHQLYEKPVPFGLDALTVASAAAGSVSRGAAVGRAAKTGGNVGRALRHGPEPELRKVKVPVKGKGEVEALLGTYSRSTLTRQTQKWLDGIRQRFPDAPILGRDLYRKVGFQQRRLGEIEERMGRIGAEELLSLAGSRKLSAAQHRALRVVGEGVPIDTRIARHRADLAKAKTAFQARRLRREIRLLEKTRKHLDGDGFKDPKLAMIYEKAKESTARREDMLALLDELAPERAAARVQKPAQMFGEGVGETFFSYSSRKRPTQFGRLGASKVIRHPRKPGTTQEFTGEAITQGRVPRGEAILAAEAELEAWRYTTILRNRDRLIQFGKELPEKESDVAIVLDELEGKTLPEEVQALLGRVSAGETLPDDALTVLARVGEGVRQQVFPGSWADLKHNPRFAGAFQNPVDGVLWIDERLLGGIHSVNPLVGFSGNVAGKRLLKGVDVVNNASRAAVLYLYPLKYITPNALSQAAFALIHQGFAAPVNLTKAARLNQKLGRKATLAIDAGMGEGFAVSLAGQTTGPLTRFNQSAARFYGKIIDVPFRRAAFLHEAHRRGYDTPDKINKLLFDDTLRDERLATFLEANAEIIDYSRLGRWERNVIRRVIFFYPWVKGASVYGARFLAEHPMKAWALDQLGKIGSASQAAALGEMLPSYGESLAPIGEEGGLPTTLNLGSVNPFTTPYQVLRAATGDPRSAYTLGSQFTPALEALITASGYTPPGQYDSGPGAAFRGLYEGLPLYNYPKRMISGTEGRVYPTTRQQDLLSLIFGTGVVPRRTDPEKLEKEAKRGR